MNNGQGIELFLDEAKTMLEINEDHDHILNLQGIIVGWNAIEKQFSEVCNIVIAYHPRVLICFFEMLFFYNLSYVYKFIFSFPFYWNIVQMGS